MHCHYPMHLVARGAETATAEWTPASPRKRCSTTEVEPAGVVDWLRAEAIEKLDGLINYAPGPVAGQPRQARQRRRRRRLLGSLRAVRRVRPRRALRRAAEHGYFSDLTGRLEEVEGELHRPIPEASGTRWSVPPPTWRRARAPARSPSCTASRAASTSARRRRRSTRDVADPESPWGRLRDPRPPLLARVATDAPAIPMISDGTYR